MAKKSNFWQENKLDIVPLLYCVAALLIMGGAYAGISKHNLAKYERARAEKAKAVVDSVNQVKDTIALSAVNEKQKQ